MTNVAGWTGVAMALACALAFVTPAQPEEIYQQPEAFLAETFAQGTPPPSFLWLNRDIKANVARILGHSNFRALRVRYWRHEGRTGWILEEIGKYQPITLGIVIDDHAVNRLKVLTYRESHGWEIRHDFFTNQFHDLTLNDTLGLSESIDGISGATLSVNATINLVRLALYFDDIATN